MKQKFFVPYETAKVLKEKGYDEPITYYFGDGIIRIGNPHTNTELSNNTPNFLFNECIAAPTYHEVVDWLESKGIRVFAHYYLDNGKWVYVIEDFKRLQDNAGFFPSREEALNAAILKALELI